MAKVSAGVVAAYSDSLSCPGCDAPLEVSGGSRFVATTTGLLAAAVVWHLTRTASGMLGWVLPVVYSVLAFSVVSPLVLMSMADLTMRPPEPSATAIAVEDGHGGGHQ